MKLIKVITTSGPPPQSFVQINFLNYQRNFEVIVSTFMISVTPALGTATLAHKTTAGTMITISDSLSAQGGHWGIETVICPWFKVYF